MDPKSPSRLLLIIFIPRLTGQLGTLAHMCTQPLRYPHVCLNSGLPSVGPPDERAGGGMRNPPFGDHSVPIALGHVGYDLENIVFFFF